MAFAGKTVELTLGRQNESWNKTYVSFANKGNGIPWNTTGAGDIYNPRKFIKVTDNPTTIQGRVPVTLDVTEDVRYFKANPGQNNGWLLKSDSGTSNWETYYISNPHRMAGFRINPALGITNWGGLYTTNGVSVEVKYYTP